MYFSKMLRKKCFVHKQGQHLPSMHYWMFFSSACHVCSEALLRNFWSIFNLVESPHDSCPRVNRIISFSVATWSTTQQPRSQKPSDSIPWRATSFLPCFLRRDYSSVVQREKISCLKISRAKGKKSDGFHPLPSSASSKSQLFWLQKPHLGLTEGRMKSSRATKMATVASVTYLEWILEKR